MMPAEAGGSITYGSYGLYYHIPSCWKKKSSPHEEITLIYSSLQEKTQAEKQKIRFRFRLVRNLCSN